MKFGPGLGAGDVLGMEDFSGFGRGCSPAGPGFPAAPRLIRSWWGFLWGFKGFLCLALCPRGHHSFAGPHPALPWPLDLQPMEPPTGLLLAIRYILRSWLLGIPRAAWVPALALAASCWPCRAVAPLALPPLARRVLILRLLVPRRFQLQHLAALSLPVPGRGGVWASGLGEATAEFAD